MEKGIAIIITICAAGLAYASWGEPSSYGWIVAVTGWIDRCFTKG